MATALALSDPFGTQDNSKWSYGAGATVSGGRLVLTPNTAYSGVVRSVANYNMTSMFVGAELVQRANNTSSTSTYMKLYMSNGSDSANAVGFAVTGTALQLIRNVANAETVVATVTYNATTHRWLRLRHDSGVFYYEASTNGSTWNVLGNWTPTFAVTSMKLVLGAGYWNTADTNVGTAVWDNLNYTPPVTPDIGVGVDVPNHTVNTAFTRTAVNSGTAATSQTWTIVSGPTGAGTTIGTAAALSWTPTVTGTYVLRHTATNGSGSSSDDLAIRVIAVGAIVPPVMGNWTEVFADDFTGTSIDTSKWAVHNGKTQNNVTTSSANVRVANSAVYLNTPSTTSGSQITTFQVDGVGKATGYRLPVGGYTEAMCWVPGNGSQWYNWPAFWTVTPTNWPVGGEIDVMEAHTNGQPSINYHYGTQAAPQAFNGLPGLPGYFGDGWHRFGVHRKETTADVYWDGQLALTLNTQDDGTPHSLVLTSGYGTPASLGAELRADWVRAWEPTTASAPALSGSVAVSGSGTLTLSGTASTPAPSTGASETFSVADGSPWPSPYTITSGLGTNGVVAADVQGGKGRLMARNNAWVKARHLGTPDAANGGMLATVLLPDQGEYANGELYFQLSADGGTDYRPTNGMSVVFYIGGGRNGSFTQLVRSVGGVHSNIGYNAMPASLTSATTWKMRFEREGAEIRMRMWLPTDPEPTTWLIQNSNATEVPVSSGKTGIALKSNSGDPLPVLIDDVSIYQPGAAPVTPAAPALSGTIALTGSGTASFSGRANAASAAAFTGSGITSFSGRVNTAQAVALTGSGTLTLSGSRNLLSYNGTIALSGAGTVALSGSSTVQPVTGAGSIALTGNGSLTLSGRTNVSGAIALSATGTSALTGQSAQRGSTALTGAGTLSLFGTASAGTERGGLIPLSGSGSLMLSGRPSARGSIALSGSGTLTTASVVRTGGSLSLSGAGTLTLSGVGRISYVGTIARTGSGRLSMSGVPRFGVTWRYRATRIIAFGGGAKAARGYNPGDIVPDDIVSRYNLLSSVAREQR